MYAFLCLLLVLAAADGASSQAPTAQLKIPLNAQFTGKWVGQLEYRDFSNNQQVFLPSWLTLAPGTDANTILFSYIYDDGPTKTVRESSTLTLDPAGSKAVVTSDRDKSNDT